MTGSWVKRTGNLLIAGHDWPNRRPRFHFSTAAGVIIFLSLLALSLAIAPVASADSTYIVQPGDNLFRIALRHGLTTQELAQANNIINPDAIYAGQVLVIPEKGATNPPDGPPASPPPSPAPVTGATTYTVQYGDTLFRIALRHGLSTYTLAQANGITNPSFIYAGQVLTIPSGNTGNNPPPSPSPSPPAPPPPQSFAGRWIDINLTNQRLTAYEGNSPVYHAIISSGAWPYTTVTGQFQIYLRYQAQDMNGYRLGFNYYLPNVPYVMYFYRDYALHGTYWHNNFGTPMSHGCVNLTIADAQWIYNWSTYGTVVNVHY